MCWVVQQIEPVNSDGHAMAVMKISGVALNVSDTPHRQKATQSGLGDTSRQCTLAYLIVMLVGCVLHPVAYGLYSTGYLATLNSPLAFGLMSAFMTLMFIYLLQPGRDPDYSKPKEPLTSMN